MVPLLLILYMTFRASMARVADANHHIAELNQLYLATVHTLAAAIDAKDQVTHGHINRVQHYAKQLAVAVGVKNEIQLKAIQAAAVLHDTGKIAIPEAILNKPGPLTTEEFAVMKQHANIGADIVSSVNFTYPSSQLCALTTRTGTGRDIQMALLELLFRSGPEFSQSSTVSMLSRQTGPIDQN